MAEVKFLLKCLAITIVLLLSLQIHWGEQTVEYHFEHWMKYSKVTQFLQKSSEGGGLFLQRTYHSVEKSLRGTASTATDHNDPRHAESTHSRESGDSTVAARQDI